MGPALQAHSLLHSHKMNPQNPTLAVDDLDMPLELVHGIDRPVNSYGTLPGVHAVHLRQPYQVRPQPFLSRRCRWVLWCQEPTPTPQTITLHLDWQINRGYKPPPAS